MSKEQPYYVDANILLSHLYAMPGPYSSGNYDPMTKAIEDRINQSISVAVSQIMATIQRAVSQSAKPYNACMLCTRRDCDDLPPNLGS